MQKINLNCSQLTVLSICNIYSFANVLGVLVTFIQSFKHWPHSRMLFMFCRFFYKRFVVGGNEQPTLQIGCNISSFANSPLERYLYFQNKYSSSITHNILIPNYNICLTPKTNICSTKKKNILITHIGFIIHLYFAGNQIVLLQLFGSYYDSNFLF